MAFLPSAVIYSIGVRAPAVETMRMMTESVIAGKDSLILSYIIKYAFLFAGILVSFLRQ